MSIEQVLYRDIPREIFTKGFSLSFPAGAREIYFKLDRDLVDKELWEIIDPIRNYPKGIMVMEALGRYNYIMIVYYPKKITEQKILEFVRSITKP